MLYTVMRSITTVIQYICKTRADSVVSSTNGLLISWLRSMTTRRKRHNSYYANPHPNMRRIQWCLRSLSVEIWKTQLHLSTVKIQLSLSTAKSNRPFSKSSNSQDHLFWAWRHPHSSPISCLGVYYGKWWLSYPLRASVKLHPMTMHLDS